MGRSRRKTPCFWPRSISGATGRDDGQVAPVELLRRQARRVERDERVEAGRACAMSSSGTRSSASRGSPRRGSAASTRLVDVGDRVLHDGVEERVACREVDVDRRADDAGAASDLGHAGVGIARQRFEGGVEDGGDAAVGVRPAALGGGRVGGCRAASLIVSESASRCGLRRSFGTKWRARGRTASATRLASVASSAGCDERVRDPGRGLRAGDRAACPGRDRREDRRSRACRRSRARSS